LKPPTKPQAAPFFLPTTLGARPTFLLPGEEEKKEDAGGEKLAKSRILNMKSDIVRTPFVQMLEAKQCEPFSLSSKTSFNFLLMLFFFF